jgi:hypothetical protein
MKAIPTTAALLIAVALVTPYVTGCANTGDRQALEPAEGQVSPARQTTAADVLLRIAARRALAEHAEALPVLKEVCARAREQAAGGADFASVEAEILDAHSDLFQQDPLLKADIQDILGLMGLAAPAPDAGSVAERAEILCALLPR